MSNAEQHQCHDGGESHCKKGHDAEHHKEHHKHECHDGGESHCKKDHGAEHHEEHHKHECHDGGEHCKKGHDAEHHHEHHKHECHDGGESHCKKGHDAKHHEEHHKHEHHHHHHGEGEHHHHEEHHHHHEAHHHHNDDLKLKLHYFNTRGRAELIRYILKFAKQLFEDIRYNQDQWPQVKENFPANQVPALEFEHCGEKVMLSQSLTIARHLAARFHLKGRNCIEAAQCDEVVDSLNDLINLAVLGFLEQDINRREMIKNRLKNEESPRILGFIESQLIKNGGKHIVGDSWTYADLAIACFLGGLENRGADIERLQQQFPTICGLWKAVDAVPEIKSWIDTRPVTEM